MGWGSHPRTSRISGVGRPAGPGGADHSRRNLNGDHDHGARPDHPGETVYQLGVAKGYLNELAGGGL